MNVNCKLTLTDDERNQMYVNMTGKATVLRLVKRKEVCEFVQGCIDAIVMGGGLDEEGAPIHEITQVTPGEAREIDRLHLELHTDSYIRGYIQVFRRFGK